MSDEGKLLESLVDYLSDGQKHTLRIYGHGASGKSTFARKLQLALVRKEPIFWKQILM